MDNPRVALQQDFLGFVPVTARLWGHSVRPYRARKASTYLSSLDTVVVPQIGIGEDTVLVLEPSISSYRNVGGGGGQRPARVALLAANWAGCSCARRQKCRGGRAGDVQEALDAVFSSVLDDDEDTRNIVVVVVGDELEHLVVAEFFGLIPIIT